jgi:competence protein ComEA
LACALLALALPRPGRRPEPCRQPSLRAAGEVVCAPAGAGPRRLAGPARRLFDLPIDPNRADVVSLETLPGIGPVRARAIAAERCRRPFASLADLERVRGLGPARVGALSPWVAFETPMASCHEASVESATCHSSCGVAGAGPGPADAPPPAAAERH